MLPHKLTMAAFGSFAEETTIDFNQLGNELYLIAGETGAGKTTIFDAICFALFGTASSDGRGSDGLYSDYCRNDVKKKDMVVSLEFSEKGETFTVVRRTCWGATGKAATTSNTAGIYKGTDTTIQPLASCANRKHDSRDNDVNLYIADLLSLDVSQFRKIVMLPQGDFSNFIKAGPNERSEILGKICDNSIYKDFEARVNAVKKNLDIRVTNQKNGMAGYLDTFHIRYETTRSGDVSGDPFSRQENIDTMNRAIKGKAEEADRIDKQKNAMHQQILDTVQQKKEAEIVNGFFDELEQNKKKLKDLLIREPGEEISHNMAEAAGRGMLVLPFENDWLKSSDELRRAERKEKDVQKQLEQAKGDMEKAASENTEIKNKNNMQVKNLQLKLGNMKEIMKLYQPLEECLDKQEKLQIIVNGISNNIEARKVELQALSEQQSKNNSELQGLRQASDSDVQIKLLECENQEKKVIALSSLLDRYDKLEKDLDILKGQLNKMKDAESLYSVAEQKYKAMYDLFCSNQAVILAKDIQINIENKGYGICPVCGVRHETADFPIFHQQDICDKEVPSQEQMELAQTMAEGLQKDWHEQEKIYNGKASDIKKDKENFLVDLKEMAGMEYIIAEWPVFADEGIQKLHGMKSDAEGLYKKLSTELDNLRKQNQRKNQLEKIQAKLAEDMNQYEADIKAMQASLTEPQGQLTEAGENVRTNRAIIQQSGAPDTRAAAEDTRDNWQKDLKKLSDEIDSAEEALKKSTERYKGLEVKLAEARTAVTDNQDKMDDAWEKFQQSWMENGFESKNAYVAAITDTDGKKMNASQLKVFIDGIQSNYNKFIKEKDGCADKVKYYEEKTYGKQKVDIEKLKHLLITLNDQYKTIDAQSDDIGNELSTMKSAMERLCIEKKNLARLQKAFETANWLNGKICSKDKKLSDFVLDKYFQAILQHANRHLQIMTDGTFTLQEKPKEEGRAGNLLDFTLFDINTNMTRDVGKLSGGETFEVSLAMALGLSDMVQLSSGSRINIDSMFIDEGFGSLGGKDLDNAIKELNRLADGKRQIGIISHVSNLEENIHKQIRVIKDKAAGSHIEM